MTTRTKRSIPWRKLEQPVPTISASSDYMTAWRAFRRESQRLAATELPPGFSFYFGPLSIAFKRGDWDIVSLAIRDDEWGRVTYEATRHGFKTSFDVLPMAVGWFETEMVKALERA